MKILFINAINTSDKWQVHYNPLSIAYLVASLKENFGNYIECKVINDNIEKSIIEFNPSIIGISSVTQNYNLAMRYAKVAKRHSLPVIIGGHHISAVPDSLTKDMDVGVIGEGETTICELLDLFMRTSFFDIEKLEKIDGIVYRDSSRNIKITKRRELITPLDKISFPSRDIYKVGNVAQMFTSRGCPYNCVFCGSTRFWKGVRYFSAEYVFNEIRHIIKEYKVKHIQFHDDTFIVNIKRIKNIVRLLEESDYIGKVTFSCNARANLIDEDTAQLLKKMGVTDVGFGFESGCTKTLLYLKGKSVTVENNKKAIKLLKKYKIDVHGDFIIGSPKESREDILKTLDFIKKSEIDEFVVTLLSPLPNTPLWDYAKSRSLVSNNMDWSRLDLNFTNGFENAVILSETLTGEELYELFKKFIREKKKRRVYHLIKKGLLHPSKALKFLKSELLKR